MTMDEDILYNPYNENNREISDNVIKSILSNYNVNYKINNIQLFRRAFIHKSYTFPVLNENVRLAKCPPNCIELKSSSNERLEFLGDGVLEMVTKSYLYKRFPYAEEGFMTEKKIALVKNDHIGKLAYNMGLHKWLIMSKNAEEKKIRTNYKKLGCLFEAFLGALYLDSNEIKCNVNCRNQFVSGIGYQTCQLFIENIYEKMVDWNELLENDDNYKNIFQVVIQKEFKKTPEYIVLNVDETMKYTMGVFLCLDDSIKDKNPENAIPFSEIGSFDDIHNRDIKFIYFTSAEHKIKKKAEQIACEKAIKLIENHTN